MNHSGQGGCPHPNEPDLKACSSSHASCNKYMPPRTGIKHHRGLGGAAMGGDAAEQPLY